MKIQQHKTVNRILLLFLVALAPALVADAQKTGGLAGSRPNIILIVVDDMGYNDLGCYDNPYVQTPNIDRLAKNGIRATQGYVNAANCAPTRAALMSGLYPPRTGIYTVGSSLRGNTEDRRLVPG